MDMDVNKVDYEPFCVKEIFRSLESVDVVDDDAFLLFQTVRK